MQVTDKHIEVIKEFLATGLQTQSFAKFFGKGNPNTDKVNACNFFKKPDIKKLVKVMREQKEAALAKATELVYTKMYSEQIATLLELDMFHTKVVRGEINVQEIFPVREKTVVTKKTANGKLEPFIEEKVLFKKVDRLPTIKEKQVSASELYRRVGAYMTIKRVNLEDQDDQEAAEKAKDNEVDIIQRCVILSNGEKIPMY